MVENSIRSILKSVVERDGAGGAGRLRNLTDELVKAAEWAESTEAMISLLSVESQQAVMDRLNRALEAAGKS
jgi:predicted lactoylglutathione lyase